MAFSMAGGGPSGPQINVTPLIDVLTLIIMFMLVVSMDPEYGEQAQIPQPNKTDAPTTPQPRTVVIEVVSTAKDQAPIVKINKEDVPWPDDVLGEDPLCTYQPPSGPAAARHGL